MLYMLCYIGAKYYYCSHQKIKLNLFLRKSIKLLPPELLLLTQICTKSLSAGASPQAPLGELTALPRQTSIAGFRGPTSKGREGKGRGPTSKGRGSEGIVEGRGWEGKGKGGRGWSDQSQTRCYGSDTAVA